MIFITGGAYQGKREIGTKDFGVTEWTDGSVCGFNEVFTAEGIFNYHILVRRLMEEEISPDEHTKLLCRENGKAVVIMDEIGCGIVPLEKAERRWREAVGRCGCMIAANSERVIRVICGIPVEIKKEQP